MKLFELQELPMDDESRLARAREMGFNTKTVYYHGTPDNRGIWKTGFIKRGGSEYKNAAFFFSSDRYVAASYADDRRAWDYQNSDPETIAVYLKMKNPKEIYWKGRSFRSNRKSAEQYSLADTIEEARSEGHDSVIVEGIRDTYDTSGKPGNVTVVFDATQIRSIKATFDPARSSSTNLMD